jgi:hypothetical protein
LVINHINNIHRIYMYLSVKNQKIPAKKSDWWKISNVDSLTILYDHRLPEIVQELLFLTGKQVKFHQPNLISSQKRKFTNVQTTPLQTNSNSARGYVELSGYTSLLWCYQTCTILVLVLNNASRSIKEKTSLMYVSRDSTHLEMSGCSLR